MLLEKRRIRAMVMLKLNRAQPLIKLVQKAANEVRNLSPKKV